MLYNNLRLLQRQCTAKRNKLSLREFLFTGRLAEKAFKMNNQAESGGGVAKGDETVLKTEKQLKNEKKKQAKLEKFAKKQQKQNVIQNEVRFEINRIFQFFKCMHFKVKHEERGNCTHTSIRIIRCALQEFSLTRAHDTSIGST